MNLSASTRSSIRRCLAVLGLVFTGGVHAAVYLNDGFTDGGFTNGDDASDAAWYTSGSTSPVFSVNTSGDFGVGSSLQVQSSGGFQRVYVPDVGGFLGVNERLTLSFDVYFTEASASNGAGFRFGVFNQGSTLDPTLITGNNQQGRTHDDFGWVVSMGVGANGLQLGFENAGNEILGASDPGQIQGIPGQTTISTANLALETSYQIEYRIDRTSSDTGVVRLFLDGVEIANATRTGLTDANFDNSLLAFGTGGSTISYRLDDVLLTVPEPAHGVLVLSGITALLLRRRRTV